VNEAKLLEVCGLGIAYRSSGRLQPVVGDVSFALAPGEVIGLAGESGCGKSTVARAAIGWLAGNAVATAGQVLYRGEPLLGAPGGRLRALWGRDLAYVPQEVSSGLNPSRRIGGQLGEMLALHRQTTRVERRLLIERSLLAVGVDPGRQMLARYPFELSGGQQQRVMIAMATLCDPRLLVLDEPTTGIDATLRREILDLIRRLLAERGMAAIYISHDLAEVASLADRLLILYGGRVVEEGPAQAVFARPAHPYARALRQAVPTLAARTLVRGIPGTPPPELVQDRCGFADRCPLVEPRCRAAPIALRQAGERRVRCILGEAPGEDRAEPSLPAIPGEPASRDLLLEVTALRCAYDHGPPVLRDLQLAVRPGELVGLVGESGSGKSTLLRSIAGLHPPSSGTIRYRGSALAGHWRDRPAGFRRELQLIFQNPERSLNPRRRVRQIVEDALRLFRPATGPQSRPAAVAELLAKVRLPSELLDRFPHQLSGGEKQRVAIARAFAASPTLLLCDEIVSALDVSVQAVVMRLVRDYVAESGAAAIFVSHDLPVVRMMCSQVLVLRHGIVCERGLTAELFRSPSDAYTRRLIGSLPRPAVEA
jgi:peptide/nickel transport system ATP-binding protein